MLPATSSAIYSFQILQLENVLLTLFWNHIMDIQLLANKADWSLRKEGF